MRTAQIDLGKNVSIEIGSSCKVQNNFKNVFNVTIGLHNAQKRTGILLSCTEGIRLWDVGPLCFWTKRKTFGPTS